MSDLTLEMSFEGSVRMGTGRAGRGLDEVIDDHMPLSAAGIKGVLRDEARLLLPATTKDGIHPDHPFLTSVFGGKAGRQCPWNFDIELDGKPRVTSRANLRLGPDRSIVEGALLAKEEAWVTRATLRVFQRGLPGSDGLPKQWRTNTEQVRQAHLALIHVAARLVDKIGQRKSRGMGWVLFVPDVSRSLSDDLALVAQIAEEAHV